MLLISDISILSILNIPKISNFNIYIKYGHFISFIEIVGERYVLFNHDLIASNFYLFLPLKFKKKTPFKSNMRVNCMKVVSLLRQNFLGQIISAWHWLQRYCISIITSKVRPQVSKKKSLLEYHTCCIKAVCV